MCVHRCLIVDVCVLSAVCSACCLLYSLFCLMAVARSVWCALLAVVALPTMYVFFFVVCSILCVVYILSWAVSVLLTFLVAFTVQTASVSAIWFVRNGGCRMCLFFLIRPLLSQWFVPSRRQVSCVFFDVCILVANTHMCMCNKRLQSLFVSVLVVQLYAFRLMCRHDAYARDCIIYSFLEIKKIFLIHKKVVRRVLLWMYIFFLRMFL